MSHSCSEQDPRKETARWIHPEVLPDEPFFLVPDPCHCNYEMRYEVLKVDDYMRGRLAYYHRAVERQRRQRRRALQEGGGEANNAAQVPQNEGGADAVAGEQQPRNEGNDAEAADEPQNARINERAAERPQNARIDIRAAARLRNDRMNRIAAEQLRYDGVRRAAEQRRNDEAAQAALQHGNARYIVRAAEHPAVHEDPERNPGRPGGLAAAVEARLARMDRIHNEQLLAAEQRNNAAIQNIAQAAQRPVPALQPLPSTLNTQDEFEAER